MKKVSVTWLILIQFVFAFEWLYSAFGKWMHPEFMAGITQTLTAFGTKSAFHAYGQFLLENVVPHAQLFGNMVRGGELAVGLSLAVCGIIVLLIKRLPSSLSIISAITFFTAAFMNLNFFLSSGWSSPSTWGINVLMFCIQVILGIFYIQQVHENKTL